MNQRVVITGLGCVSPLGNDVSTTWQNIRNNQSGVALITHYDTSDYVCKIAAEVKDFDGSSLFGVREARRMDRGTQFALAAAKEAVQDADLEINETNRERIGAVIGTGIGGGSQLALAARSSTLVGDADRVVPTVHRHETNGRKRPTGHAPCSIR